MYITFIFICFGILKCLVNLLELRCRLRLYMYICIYVVCFSIAFLQDFTVSIMLHLSWVDARFEVWASGNDDKFVLEFDSKRLDNIWTPDLFFPNEKSAFIHKVFMPNKMLRVYSGGKVSYTVRYKVYTVSDHTSPTDLLGFSKIFNLNQLQHVVRGNGCHVVEMVLIDSWDYKDHPGRGKLYASSLVLCLHGISKMLYFDIKRDSVLFLI